MPSEIMKAGESRVWMFPDGIGPGKEKLFLGCARIGDPAYNFGDMTRIECPDENRYNEFVEVSSFQGTKERPTASIVSRFDREAISELLKAGRKRCRVDNQAHIGKCRNPQNFNAGWEKILVFRDARFTSWTGENFGALGTDEQSQTNETGEFSAADIYEIKHLLFGLQCDAEVIREIVAIVVCDELECGDCDTPSDGCQNVFAIMLGVGATPGTLPSVVYSGDGGVTCAATDITTLYSNEDPGDAACVGDQLVVTSVLGGVHLAPSADILAGTEVWLEQSLGIDMNGGNGPISIWSVDSRHTWIGGANGYIYFSDNPVTGWTLQDPGIAMATNIVDIHALDALNVVAVGVLNQMAHTENGGDTWEPVAGPMFGDTLNCVWMYDEDTWLVGTSTGGLYLTQDKGVTPWVNVAPQLPVVIVEVDEIIFFDDTVGYMSARDGAAHSLIFRTIDGGQTWYVLPEGPGVIPDNDRINMLAVCPDPNIVWGAGLDGGGALGIIVKAA